MSVSKPEGKRTVDRARTSGHSDKAMKQAVRVCAQQGNTQRIRMRIAKHPEHPSHPPPAAVDSILS